MQEPKQELEDVISAFKEAKPVNGLKKSGLEEVSGLSEKLIAAAGATKAALVRAEPSFGQLQESSLANVCVDESVISRSEFSVSCQSNRNLAYVGDSRLSYYLSQRCFKARKAPSEFQALRNERSNTENLAATFDFFFGEEKEKVVLLWTFGNPSAATPTKKQKATFMVRIARSIYLY